MAYTLYNTDIVEVLPEHVSFSTQKINWQILLADALYIPLAERGSYL